MSKSKKITGWCLNCFKSIPDNQKIACSKKCYKEFMESDSCICGRREHFCKYFTKLGHY